MDIPTIGQVIEKFDLDNFEGTIKTLEDCETVFKDMCYASETNGRQFTPFEFIAKEINDYKGYNDIDLNAYDSEDMWNAFDEGITEAFNDYWDKTVSLWYDKNPVVVISWAKMGSGYNIDVIPSDPRISENSLNMCNARGKAEMLSGILIESHKDSAKIIVIE